MRRKVPTCIECWQRLTAENHQAGHLWCDACSGRDAVHAKLTKVLTEAIAVAVQVELFDEPQPRRVWRRPHDQR